MCCGPIHMRKSCSVDMTLAIIHAALLFQLCVGKPTAALKPLASAWSCQVLRRRIPLVHTSLNAGCVSQVLFARQCRSGVGGADHALDRPLTKGA